MIEETDVLTLAEAAAILRVHPVTLRKRAATWGVPHRRLGAEWRFSRKVLTAWIQSAGEPLGNGATWQAIGSPQTKPPYT